MKNLLEETLTHSELILCLYFPFLSPSIFIMYKLISTQLIFFILEKKREGDFVSYTILS